MTTWRIYHAEVYFGEPHYRIELYNKFNNHVDTLEFGSMDRVQHEIGRLKKIEPEFTANWNH